MPKGLQKKEIPICLVPLKSRFIWFGDRFAKELLESFSPQKSNEVHEIQSHNILVLHQALAP